MTITKADMMMAEKASKKKYRLMSEKLGVALDLHYKIILMIFYSFDEWSFMNP